MERSSASCQSSAPPSRATRRNRGGKGLSSRSSQRAVRALEAIAQEYTEKRQKGLVPKPPLPARWLLWQEKQENNKKPGSRGRCIYGRDGEPSELCYCKRYDGDGTGFYGFCADCGHGAIWHKLISGQNRYMSLETIKHFEQQALDLDDDYSDYYEDDEEEEEEDDEDIANEVAKIMSTTKFQVHTSFSDAFMKSRDRHSKDLTQMLEEVQRIAASSAPGSSAVDDIESIRPNSGKIKPGEDSTLLDSLSSLGSRISHRPRRKKRIGEHQSVRPPGTTVSGGVPRARTLRSGTTRQGDDSSISSYSSSFPSQADKRTHSGGRGESRSRTGESQALHPGQTRRGNGREEVVLSKDGIPFCPYPPAPPSSSKPTKRVIESPPLTEEELEKRLQALGAAKPGWGVSSVPVKKQSQ